eukprot:Gb_03436 [translate_table: standard]
MCLIQMACPAKKINHAGIVLCTRGDAIFLIHAIEVLPSCIHQACMAACRQKSSEGDVVWLHTCLLHLVKECKCFLTMAMNAIPCYHCSP